MRTLFLSVLAASFALAAADSKPNLTGAWKINLAKSEAQAEPDVTLTIRHNDPEFLLTQESSGEKLEFKLAIDGKPYKTNLPNGMEATSVLRWEGKVILAETSLDGNLAFKDKITLSDDGKTMVFDRRVVGGGTEEPQKLVFEKQ